MDHETDEQFNIEFSPEVDLLTNRQSQVVQLMLDGIMDKRTIGNFLGISERTVKNYMEQIKERIEEYYEDQGVEKNLTNRTESLIELLRIRALELRPK